MLPAIAPRWMPSRVVPPCVSDRSDSSASPSICHDPRRSPRTSTHACVTHG